MIHAKKCLALLEITSEIFENMPKKEKHLYERSILTIATTGEKIEDNFAPIEKDYKGIIGCKSVELGLAYVKGDGVPKDYRRAVQYFRLAADNQRHMGRNNLGFCYLAGRGVEQDLKTAIYHFQIAARQGSSIAEKTLSFCTEVQSVSEVVAKAVEFYQSEVHKRHPDAQRLLNWRKDIA
jgi:hypothetical protein